MRGIEIRKFLLLGKERDFSLAEPQAIYECFTDRPRFIVSFHAISLRNHIGFLEKIFKVYLSQSFNNDFKQNYRISLAPVLQTSRSRMSN